MYKQKLIVFLLVSFVCSFSGLFSQITATPSVACVPSNVQFTNPPGATSIFYTFGDGGTSVLSNPSHNYITPGNFVVTMTCNLGTYTTLVNINPLPTANFNYTVPSVKCAPLTVNFTDASSSGTTITQWQWAFGNGATTVGISNPSNVYGQGSFNVNLTVTDANGCSNTISKGPINVSALPNVIISSNPSPASGCTAPFTAAFSGSNSTTGSPTGGGLTYNWSFAGGNPGSSGNQTPGNVTYNTTGSYVASLTVTDNNNCSATAYVPVNVSQPMVSVTVPTFVCIYDTLKANDNSTAAFTIWQFGDGFSSQPITPAAPPYINVKKYFYSTPGIKTLTITAYSGGTCTAVLTKTISVVEVTAAITATPPSFSCSNPFTNQYFSSTSPNAVSYSWSTTGCGSALMTSTLTNPTFTFTQGSLNPYTILPYCVPNVNLIAMSVEGCTASASISADTLRRPTAWFVKNKKEGCTPLAVTFRDSSFAHPTPTAAIVSYTWNNGAQPPVTVIGTTMPMPFQTFTYSSPGTYTPYLIIQTVQGCIDTSFVDTVTVVDPAPLSFSFNPSVVCPNQTVNIVNTTPSLSAIQHWHVDSDAGFFSGCVSDPNPGWVFTHIGVHSFTLSAWKNSCASSTTIPQTVTVNGPIVQSRFTTNCTDRKTVLFTSHLQDALNGVINFGDGSPVVNFTGVLGGSASHTVNHTYANTGNYTVSVTGSNGSGTCTPYTYTMLVQVRDVQAAIVTQPTNCVNYSTVFSAATSTDVLVTCSTGYTWFFDNAPPIVTTSNAVTYSWPAPGIHTVVLRVKDLNSCQDTVIRNIRISEPDPQFSASPSNTICLSTGTLQFNNSTPQTPDPITNYSWNFGDLSPVSTVTDPIHTYTSASVPSSTFLVSLTATNSLGCFATQTMVVQVNNPSAQLTALPGNSLCVNQTVNISAPSGYQTYSLSYGDGTPVSVGSNSSSVHTYTAPGIFTASIAITDMSGCKGSGTMAVNVQSYPTANFSVISSGAQLPNVACIGGLLTFSNMSTSTPSYDLSYNWNYGTGTSTLQSPGISYTTTGVVPVTLTVSTPNGCSSTITKTISIYKVEADMDLDKNTICLGQSVKVNVKDSSFVASWKWDFDDGTVLTFLANPPPAPFASHTYSTYPAPTGTLLIKAIFYSELGACTATASEVLQIIKIDASFDRNDEIAVKDSVHCLGDADLFVNTTPSGNYSFNWNFGDGATSGEQNPSYTYPAPGVYPVSFTVTESSTGCYGSSSKNMTINPLPVAGITATQVCQNILFPLTSSVSGSAPFSYTWSPPDGITDVNSGNTTATASVTTEYTLDVIDVNGCTTTAVQSIYVQAPPDNIQWDTTVVVGQSIPVNGTAGQNMSYTWTPATHLSCEFCANPVSTSTDNITYSVTVADNMGCFITINTYTIHVDPKGSVDVPTAFTPNGDGVNDVIFPDGWGIKKLNYFRVYNRWGQLLFESNDISIGWDGTFNGVPQNMETYVYQVSVETFVDAEALIKTGSFKLIR